MNESCLKIALISNYLPDAQQSMIRYAALLQAMLSQCGHVVKVLHPPSIFGSMPIAKGRLAKWIGHIDKYVMAPLYLRWNVRKADIVHICDHSNAMYLSMIGTKAKVITCHDLIAIYGARNKFDGVRVGISGRLLQMWISSSLVKAPHIICVSNKTESDLREMSPRIAGDVRVIHHTLNADFSPAAPADIKRTLNTFGLPVASQYLLHVGGNQWYKNRLGVLRIFDQLRKNPGFPFNKLIMAGKPWAQEMRSYCASSGLDGSVVEATDLSNRDLCALYSGASALLFPSLEEGFGWPILEAQACGCPVITSNRPPLTEIAGEAAVFIDPEFPDLAALEIIRSLPQLGRLREAGFQNISRFSMNAVSQAYCDVYRDVGKADLPRRDSKNS